LLCDADAFDNLRMQVVQVSYKQVNGRRWCLLCGSDGPGLAHVLGQCVAIQVEREEFLRGEGGARAWALRSALLGDWPTAVLSPHSGVKQLAVAVRYASAVVHKLKTASNQNNTT